MRVLLLQAYLGRKEQLVVFPLGICYIATALSNSGHDVRALDLNLCGDPFTDLEKELRAFRPEVVGISLRNIDTTQKKDIFYYFKTLRPTAQLIKKVDPSIKTLIGGAGFSMFATEIMEKVTEIDMGVYLEGEESVVNLLGSISNPQKVKGIFCRDKGKIVFTGPEELPDVERLPIPRRDFFEVNRYIDPAYVFSSIGIQTKRGCPLRCAYCTYPFLNGKRTRLRTPQSVVDEIEYLADRFGVKNFTFADSVFNIPSGHAEGICREIIRRKVNQKVRWTAWFEIKGFTEGILYLAKEAGCYGISFSPDAASDESLKALGKGIKEEDIYRSLEIAKSAKGVWFGYSFFCTPPGQDLRGFLKTVKLFFAVNLMLLGKGNANISWIRVEPQTRMHTIAINEGVLKREDTLLPDDEKGLERLFYSCPATAWYADPVFSLLAGMRDTAQALVKKIKKGKKAAACSG